MRRQFLLIFMLFFAGKLAVAQASPEIQIKYSKLFATYHFVQKLADHYPDNELKEIFKASKYNTTAYQDLLKLMQTLEIQESYSFQNYSFLQKRAVMTTSILERNLIGSASLAEFKSKSFGVVPSSELMKLSKVLFEFEKVYDQLFFLQHQGAFYDQLEQLKSYVQKSDLSSMFQAGLVFYGATWDASVPVVVAIIPSIGQGFSARVFLNQAVSELPLDFKRNDILFSVLMHEIYHIQYDEQPLQLKQQLEEWFKINNSPHSQYAFLLLNEVLATALGNGFVYEKLNEQLDTGNWYNNKYINDMSKALYSLIKGYVEQGRIIDKNFVDRYIEIYDQKFSHWDKELHHILMYRYVITDNPEDFNYFGATYRNSSVSILETPFAEADFSRLKQTAITKVLLVSSDNFLKLERIRSAFVELEEWEFKASEDFVYTVALDDKTRLIVVNSVIIPFSELFESAFKDRLVD